MAPTLTIKPQCQLQWRLLRELDNSNNAHSTITIKVKYSTSKTINGKEYSKEVEDLSKETATKTDVKVESSVKWGAVSATVSAGHEVSTNVKNFVSSTVEVSREQTFTENISVEEEYSVGPGDKLYLYQLVFTGTGLNFDTDTTAAVSTKKTSADNVPILIDVVTTPIEFVTDINVVYGKSPSDAPSDRVRDLNHGGDDINKGFKGDFVWIVPVYTLNFDLACTSFDLVIQDDSIPGRKDLAKGAGGSYRYLIPNRDPRQAKKITKLALIRQGNAEPADILRAKASKELGGVWGGANDDINGGRGGDYLWLATQQY